MSATTRTRWTATYSYPGFLFPEETSRPVDHPTLQGVLEAAPRDEDGYFRADGWYAARVTQRTQKLYTAADGEEQWIQTDVTQGPSWLIGEKVHLDDIPDDDDHAILRSNIRCNTKDGIAVKTRLGNWTLPVEGTEVIAASEVSS